MFFRRAVERLQDNKSILSEGIAATGAIAGVLAIFLPEPWDEYTQYAMTIFFVIAACIYIIFRRLEHLPPPRQNSVYFINLPCTPAELDDAIGIAQYYFDSDSMKPDSVREAYRNNPFSFIVIKDATGRVVGYFDHFGLKEASFDSFLKGQLIESDMDSKHFAGGDEIRRTRRAYIGGIAIRAKSKHEVGKITKCLLFASCDLLLKRYMRDDQDFTMYASGFTKEGREMMKSLGFGILTEGEDRPDSVPLFWRSVSRKEIARYKQNYPVARAELVLTYTRPPGLDNAAESNDTEVLVSRPPPKRSRRAL